MAERTPTATARATSRWIEASCTLVDGAPFRLMPWQRRAIAGILGAPTSAICCPRGSGKTGLLSALGAAVVSPGSPLHAPGRELLIVSPSYQQSFTTFADADRFVGQSHDVHDRRVWSRQATVNAARLTHKASGAGVRCVSQSPKRIVGARPWIAAVDEPSELERSTRDRTLATLETGLGKGGASGHLLAIGTASPDNTHWWHRWVEDDEFRGFRVVYRADPEGDPLATRTVAAANPAWRAFPWLRRRILAERDAARRDPAKLASYRAYRLNLGVPDAPAAMLVEAADWQRAEGDAPGEGPYSLGLDLGGSVSHSAAAAFWWRTGRLEGVSLVGDDPPLAERGLADGVGGLYVEMARAGELITSRGRTARIARLLREVRERWGLPSGITADRYRESELRDALDDAGWPVLPLMMRGQGYRDGSEDVRGFRRALLEGHVVPVRSLGMRAALAGARVVGDPSGNIKLARSSEGGRLSTHRDDLAAAAVLAIASAAIRLTEPLGGARAG